MIATTVVRVAGLVYQNSVDTIWEVYWTLLSAEVGVFLAASTAFRAFFVARSNTRKESSAKKRHYVFSQAFAAKFLRKKPRSYGDTLNSEPDNELPNIPRAQITGMRTFIDRHGRTQDHPGTAPAPKMC